MKVFTGMEREESFSCLKVLLQEVQSCAPTIIRTIPPPFFFPNFITELKYVQEIYLKVLMILISG